MLSSYGEVYCVSLLCRCVLMMLDLNCKECHSCELPNHWCGTKSAKASPVISFIRPAKMAITMAYKDFTSLPIAKANGESQHNQLTVAKNILCFGSSCYSPAIPDTVLRHSSTV